MIRFIAVGSILFIACGGSPRPAPQTRDCPPPSAPEVAAPEVMESPRYSAEATIEIEFQGTWYPGTVVQWLRDDLYEVGYEGYGDDWNRVARESQLRPRAEEVAPPVPPPGFEVTDVANLAPRDPVFVEWGDAWYPATVRRVADGRAWVRYDGYDKEWDEEVDRTRVRTMRPAAGQETTPAEPAPPSNFPPDPRGST
ncbi:MAG: agenet domain-containing protein [Myxococcota bacterium]